ncbi:MAG TPA: AAA family ATPase [Nakamurella sp.]
MSTVALVGREAESAAADRLLVSAKAGSGGALLVVGEAGIGKTRLLIEVADRAETSGFTVLTGRCVPGGGTYRALTEAVLAHLRDAGSLEDPSLRPYRAALGRLAPGWESPDAGPSSPNGADPVVVLGEGLLRLLILAGGAGAGCLLVLEDLHWADPDTVGIVGYLVSAVLGSPVVIAASAWDDQPGALRTLRPADSVVASLSRQPGVTTVRLGRLDHVAVAELATVHAGARPVDGATLATLIDHADGLPVLVEDLLDGLLDDPSGRVPVPRTLSDLVAQRMAELDPGAQRVLQAAALLGEEPAWSLLGPLTGLDAGVVSAGLRAGTGNGLLSRRGVQLVWRHSLTRAAVVSGMLPTDRAALVDRGADLLLARETSDDDALAADLLAEAGESARATEIMRRLARRDMARGALRAAEHLIVRATSLGAPAPGLAVDRTRLLTLLGRPTEALTEGVPLLDALSGDEHADLCLELARAAVVAGRWRQACRLVNRAGRPGDPRSLVLDAEAAFGEGDVARATDRASDAVAAAESAGSAEVLCAALVITGRCATLTSMELASASYRRAAQCAAEHGLVPWRVEALFGLGLAELVEGRPIDSLSEARELALDAGLLIQVLSLGVLIAEHTMTVDGPAAAEPLARRTEEEANRLGLSGLAALAGVALAAGRAAVGDSTGMTAALTAAGAHANASIEVTALASAARAWPHLLEHDLPRANAQLDEAMTSLTAHGSAAPVAYWGLWVLLRTVVADRDEEARDFLRTAPVGMAHLHRAALAYADAVVAGRAGDADRAGERLAEADRLVADRPYWRRLLRLLTFESAVLDGWGDPVPALRADLHIHQEHGDDQLARTCRDLLRRAGAETRRGRGDTPVPPELRVRGVTSREMDVLQLVAQGMSNAEVASRLFLSPRTVDTHVASLLAKTGAARRGELRELAADLPR